MGFRDDYDALAAQLEVTRREAARERASLEQQLDEERALERDLTQRVGKLEARDPPEGKGRTLVMVCICLQGLLLLLVAALWIIDDQLPTRTEAERGAAQAHSESAR
jgi:hypothetical protein